MSATGSLQSGKRGRPSLSIEEPDATPLPLRTRPPANARQKRETSRAVRACAAARVIQAGLDVGVPLIQTLRRRRLKPATVSAYTSEAKSFLETNSLPSAPAPPNLVSLLTLNLIEVYLRGAGGGGVARRYYAVRWWYCLDNSSLRLAYESMLASLPRSASPDPICWEEALIMALYLLRVKLPREKQGLLFDITPNDWVSLFAESREATGLKKANPHQLRHGGASADAMQKPPPPDLELMGRGDWSQPKSVKVYRRTGIYARRMQMLTPGQRATAATARHLILALFKQRLFQ